MLPYKTMVKKTFILLLLISLTSLVYALPQDSNNNIDFTYPILTGATPYDCGAGNCVQSTIGGYVCVPCGGSSSFNSTYDATSKDVTANRTAFLSTYNSSYYLNSNPSNFYNSTNKQPITNIFNQNLNTTNSPTFAGLTLTSTATTKGINMLGDLNYPFANKNAFGGNKMYSVDTQNFLWLADKRFNVTYSNFKKIDGTTTSTDTEMSYLFNNNWENGYNMQTNAGNVSVLNINLTGKGEYTSNGLTYAT